MNTAIGSLPVSEITVLVVNLVGADRLEYIEGSVFKGQFRRRKTERAEGAPKLHKREGVYLTHKVRFMTDLAVDGVFRSEAKVTLESLAAMDNGGAG